MGQHPLWRKCKSVVSYGKQAISYEAESPAFRHGEFVKRLDETRIDTSIKVIEAIVRAIEIVSSHPHHKAG